MPKLKLFALGAVLVVCVGGCAVNPVTGQRELVLVSASEELAIGRAQYLPAQQMQGGIYATDPELSAYVDRVGQKLAVVSGSDLPYEFVVLNNSLPNAWALPGGKVAINRGLLTALNNEAELAAVLGHEVVHAAARHGAKQIERGLLLQGLLLGAAVGTYDKTYAAGVLVGAQLAAGLIGQKYSRDAEREADFYGTRFMARAGYDPYGAVMLQETFVRLAGEKRSSWTDNFFASHPASQERLANNRELAEQLRAQGFNKGVLGAASYNQAMAKLRESAPAYAAYDEAIALYESEDYDAALSRVNHALASNYEEALFHGLRGAIRVKQGREDDALINFNRAIDRHAEYYVYYISRGLIHRQQGDIARAKVDLSASLDLLPTASAYQALGELAESEGDMSNAKRYYAQAGKGQGPESQAAIASLTRLELPEQPEKYIGARMSLGSDNTYRLLVINRAAVALKNVRVRLDIQTPQGSQSWIQRIEGIAAGQSRSVSVNLPSAADDGVQIRVYPVGAEIAGG